MYYGRLFFPLISFIALVIPSYAKTIFVDDNALASGDGTSWVSAHKYLQDALAVAEYGDEIWVAEGTYKPDQGAGKTEGDRTASFNLVNGVGLYGGFLGREVSRDPLGDSNQTILSGEIDSNSSLWSLHVLLGADLDDGTTLDGFRITKGNANGEYFTDYSYGGGISLHNSGLTLSNLVFTDNSASHYGGGISLPTSSVTLTNCVFTNNSADTGGGINYSSWTGSLTLINCVFTNNSAYTGGGIQCISASSVTLTNCVFTNNSARDDGGGISLPTSSPVTLTNCVFKNNSASDDGGGIYSPHSHSVTLTNCVFTNNSASYDGGGIYSFANDYNSSSVTLTNCVFTNNSASDDGGGIYSYSSSYYSDSVTLTNCVFTNNSASDDGGGIYSFANDYSYDSSSSVTLTNCVFTNNSASDDGGGICSYSNYSSYKHSSVILANCILWKNESNGIIGHGLISPEPELWHSHILEFGVKATYPGDPNAREFLYQPNINILQGWGGDVRAFNSDPLFVNIDNPIGPDGIWFTDDDGLRVQTDSPAIDAGYNDSLPPDTNDLDKDSNTTEPIPYDALGKTRRIGTNVDIGAYEFGDGNSLSQKRFLLSLSAGNGGLVNGAGYFEEGVDANISATASIGYIFSNWSGDASGSLNPLSITIDADKSITAVFVQDLNDADGDGLTNYAELVTYRTDPNSSDTDNDGLTDKQEIERGWDPNYSDKSLIDAVMEMKGLNTNTTPYSEGWFYLPNQGWLWTTRTTYPYFFDSTSKAWMYFQSGNEKPKFYHYGTNEWMTVE